MNRAEAFKKVINIRGVYAELGYDSGFVTNLRRNLKRGKVSEDMMKKVLLKYGAKVQQEESWHVPEP